MPDWIQGAGLVPGSPHRLAPPAGDRPGTSPARCPYLIRYHFTPRRLAISLMLINVSVIVLPLVLNRADTLI